jgi:hypothetical protein
MKRTKIVLILLLLIAFIYFMLTFDRAGGEIGFDAIVKEVNGSEVRACVIDSGSAFLSPKLPSEIVFTTDDSGITNLQVGDTFSGCWLLGSLEGESVRVVSIKITERANNPQMPE